MKVMIDFFKKFFNIKNKKRNISDNNQDMLKSLKNDYGREDVYGLWTTNLTNDDGTIKFFKSYWFISTNDKIPNIETLSPYDNDKCF